MDKMLFLSEIQEHSAPFEVDPNNHGSIQTTDKAQTINKN